MMQHLGQCPTHVTSCQVYDSFSSFANAELVGSATLYLQYRKLIAVPQWEMRGCEAGAEAGAFRCWNILPRAGAGAEVGAMTNGPCEIFTMAGSWGWNQSRWSRSIHLGAGTGACIIIRIWSLCRICIKFWRHIPACMGYIYPLVIIIMD